MRANIRTEMKDSIRTWKVLIDADDVQYATDVHGEELILTGTLVDAQHELDYMMNILEERYGMIEHVVLESQGKGNE